MTELRGLDHIAVLVRSTDDALLYFRDRLGLALHSSEKLESPAVRLTYLDAGNVFIQLLEPLDDDSTLASTLDLSGEGLHHICFRVDDVPGAVADLSDPDATPTLGTGRGRISGFVDTASAHGVLVECTEFRTGDRHPPTAAKDMPSDNRNRPGDRDDAPSQVSC